MEIEVRLFATLRAILPAGSSAHSTKVIVEEGEQARDVLTRLGLPMDRPVLLVRNGIQCGTDVQVQDGDVLSVFPPLGGG
jgi:sulfur-carrier protein